MENQQHWFNIGGVYFPCRPQCYFCTSCRHEFLSLLHYSWHSRCFLLSKLHTRHGRSSGSSLTLPEGLNGSIRFNPGLNESHLFAWIIKTPDLRAYRSTSGSERVLMSGPGVWAVPQLWWSSCVGMLNTGDTSQLTFFFKINELFSVCVGHLKFCQEGTWRSKVEWSQSKSRELGVRSCSHGNCSCLPARFQPDGVHILWPSENQKGRCFDVFHDNTFKIFVLSC